MPQCPVTLIICCLHDWYNSASSPLICLKACFLCNSVSACITSPKPSTCIQQTIQHRKISKCSISLMRSPWIQKTIQHHIISNWRQCNAFYFRKHIFSNLKYHSMMICCDFCTLYNIFDGTTGVSTTTMNTKINIGAHNTTLLIYKSRG